MSDLTPDDVKRIRTAFLFRMGYVAVAWLAFVMLLNRFGPGGAVFGSVVTVLTFALIIVLALIAPMDWRWLNKHPNSVNRFGLRIGIQKEADE